jgi:hypothetical protein
VALLVAHAGGARARAVVGLAILGLVASQLLGFYRVFVAADVYDPTSFGLLTLRGFLP